MVMIREKLHKDHVKRLTDLLRMFRDVFAFLHEETMGIDPEVSMHLLNVKPKCKPVNIEVKKNE